MNIGFEDPKYGHGCLHADFANKFLGGGVLSGDSASEGQTVDRFVLYR